MKQLCVLLLVPLLFAACESNVTKPSPPSPPIPSVAGHYYAGTIQGNYWGPITTSVTQSGTTVTIEPLQVSNGRCPLTIPFGETTIDETGSFGKKSGTFSWCDCFYYYDATGGFVERELRISLHASTNSPLDEYDFPVDGCYDLRPAINLTRQ
jgi:hypothetical protein